MSRARLRKEVRRRRGAMGNIAIRAGVTLSMVSKWLAGKTDSASVEAHVREYVSELLSEGSHAQ